MDALGGIYADKVFFGAAALSFQKGVMNFDAEMPRVFLRAARERILVIDSSKIGTEAVYRLCAVEKCDIVVTDDGVKAADLARLRKLTSILVAK
jgi:DeoR family fructose operon transcriptional repressor